MGGKFFTDFKSSNRIEISWLVQALLNFYWFRWSTPLGGGGWVDEGGGGYGCVGGVPCTHTCMHTYTHMHMHVKHANHAKHGCLHVGGHLQFLYMYTCAYVHVRACVCMGGHSPMPPDAPHIPPPTCPLPRAAGRTKHQNSISPELIKIIWFCLKILNLWTFLNSYRL